MRQTPVVYESLLDYDGEETMELSAGQRLQIRSGSAGSIETHLDTECPTGKKWVVQIYVKIHESNV